MPGAKASNIETANRVFTIQGWIINGVQDYLILKQCQQQFLKSDGKPIGLRQAKNLLAKAYQAWHEEQVTDIDQKRTMRIAELKQDIRNMKDEYKGTPRGMAVVNQIKKEISKLEALYPAKKVIVQGDRDNPIILEDGFGPEKQARLDALIAKATGTQK
ncbi:hypothetical protein [Flavobacterium sp. 102]|uniref:hypothetical protein n=1 Tax=Flavobacterium sp. 102 TaxID=2135623 RepID=UPI000EB53B3D|nr:hypothetical protein [Flavobacterium sp. 102]RKS00430.1 hypothetical protein C8C84_0040 [Flavobacterium sp. 102]